MSPAASRNGLASALLGFVSTSERLRRARKQLEDFSNKFPFRRKPQLIEDLTPSDIYNKGSRDYFFYWVEHGTFDVGHLTVYDAGIYEEAGLCLPTLKSLLRIAADDTLSVGEKVDAPWQNLKGFGGDRHIAKKIIALLYPENVFPIFNTQHFEYFAFRLGIDFAYEAGRRLDKGYVNATVGEVFEALNASLLRWREVNAPAVDNIALGIFLYETFPPPDTLVTQPRKPSASRSLSSYQVVCPKCGRSHTLNEYGEKHFCRDCGSFLSLHVVPHS